MFSLPDCGQASSEVISAPIWALTFSFLRGKIKTRRAINPIAIEQGHRRHLVLGADFGQFLGNRSSFKKAECGAGVKFDVHRLSVTQKSASESLVSGHDFSRADKPLIFLPEPALAGGTMLWFQLFRSPFSRTVTSQSSVVAGVGKPLAGRQIAINAIKRDVAAHFLRAVIAGAGQRNVPFFALPRTGLPSIRVILVSHFPPTSRLTIATALLTTLPVLAALHDLSVLLSVARRSGRPSAKRTRSRHGGRRSRIAKGGCSLTSPRCGTAILFLDRLL